MFRLLPVALLISLCCPVILLAADAPLPLPSVAQQVLLQDLPAHVDKPLFDCLQALPPQKVLSLVDIYQKRFNRLRALAKSVNGQRDSMLEFDGYVKWMGGTLSSYSKYVEAGSFAAGFARLLPVPYAGQAGQFSKFVAHFALSLSSTSVAVKQYLDSSQQFLAGVEALGVDGKGKRVKWLF